jgi:hypothetical protein
MVAILRELGDDAANRRPALPGANAPYAIVTHVLGVLEFWGGRMIAGRAIERDRDAEFVATGEVAELIARVAEARARFADDLSSLDSAAPPHGELAEEDADTPMARSQGGVLWHIYEELAQHLGQLELTRDLLRSATIPAPPPAAS